MGRIALDVFVAETDINKVGSANFVQVSRDGFCLFHSLAKRMITTTKTKHTTKVFRMSRREAARREVESRLSTVGVVVDEGVSDGGWSMAAGGRKQTMARAKASPEQPANSVSTNDMGT